MCRGSRLRFRQQHRNPMQCAHVLVSRSLKADTPTKKKEVSKTKRLGLLKTV